MLSDYYRNLFYKQIFLYFLCENYTNLSIYFVKCENYASTHGMTEMINNLDKII